jgi:hypothetical protein
MKEPDLMTDPVTGLPITTQKWQEMSDRANVGLHRRRFRTR